MMDRSSAPGIWIFAWLAALAVFVVMAVFASIYDRFPGDLWLLLRIQELDGNFVRTALGRTEDILAGQFVIVSLLGAIVALLVASWPRALLFLGPGTATVIKDGVKWIVGRPRPTADLVEIEGVARGLSFPSGHAVAALMLYGLIFYMVTVYIPQRWVRIPVQALCVWMIIVGGIERSYVGQHWPSDVLAGYLMGALLLAILIAIDRLLLSRPAVTERLRNRFFRLKRTT